MSEQLYKVLDEERRPIHGGNGQWLPAGEWMPPIENIIMCERGYHVCNREQLVLWLGPTIWMVETRGEHAEADNKQVWTEARLVKRLETWNSRTQRLFACDCAEHVLHLFEQERPDDTRPRGAIEAARLFAEGKATNEELAAAADTAKAAAWSADAAAWPAAEAAAEDAARSAAWSAVWAMESAARAKAWAMESAARAKAWVTARDAERAWQTERLFWYLEGEGQ
jgi:hypothetical protein